MWWLNYWSAVFLVLGIRVHIKLQTILKREKGIFIFKHHYIWLSISICYIPSTDEPINNIGGKQPRERK